MCICLIGLPSLTVVGCGGSPADTQPGLLTFSARPDAPDAFGWQLFTTGPGGKGTRRLSENDGEINPSWSPDGSRIAYEGGADDCGLDACGQVWVMNADGTGKRRLTSPAIRAEAPRWSPDSSSIAYVQWLDVDSDRIIETALYLVSEDGTGDLLLADGRGWDTGPVWAPDGTRVAFWSDRDDPKAEAGELYVINADGTNEMRLTHTRTDEGRFDWSPGSDELVVSMDRGASYELYVVNADGSGERQLTHTPHADEDDALWSPDGDSIVFDRSTDDGSALVLLDLDSGRERMLTRPENDDVPQSWSPDGDWVAFTRGDDFERLWLIDSEKANATRVDGQFTEASLGTDWTSAAG